MSVTIRSALDLLADAIGLRGFRIFALVVIVATGCSAASPTPSPLDQPTAASRSQSPTPTRPPTSTTAPSPAEPSPSQEPLSTTVSPPEGRVTSVPGVDAIVSWSPDGRNLLVYEQPHPGTFVLDAGGADVGRIGSTDVSWVDADTLAVQGDGEPGRAGGPISLTDIRGNQVSMINGDFGSYVASPGNRLMALVSTTVDDETFGTSYRVWNDGDLSETRYGEPLTWSNDGSMLAVLIPQPRGVRQNGSSAIVEAIKSAGDPSDVGMIRIVDRSGRTVSDVSNWLGTTLGEVAFSPDSRYLAACLRTAKDQEPSSTHVVDTQDGSVVASLPNDCFFGWTDDLTLYDGSGLTAPHKWTPSGGVSGFGVDRNSHVTAALDGSLAVWTDGRLDATLKVRTKTVSATYSLPGLQDVEWNPYGSEVAAIFYPDSGTGPSLALISVMS